MAGQKTKKALLDKSENPNKTSSNTSAKIFYMSSYLKTKKIPELKELQKEQDESFFLSLNKNTKTNNIIILDQYRKEKNRKRVWKKEFPKEALNVAGLAFLFLFTFNVAVSLQSNFPSQTFNFTGLAAKEENTQHNSGQRLKEDLGLESDNSIRQTAKEKRKQEFSYKHWTQKINQLDRKNLIFGKKPSSSEYFGF